MRTYFFCLCSIFAVFTASAQIVINEIMYNSPGDDVEFVELYNAGSQAVDLTGWTLLDDNDAHIPCRLSGVLAPGAYFVVAQNLALFRRTYPGVSRLNPFEYGTGSSGWSLGNEGDTVRLFDAGGNLHDFVPYLDRGAWPSQPDGNGPSLELINPFLDNALPTHWDPSTVAGGTPGRKNSVYAENIRPICKDGVRLIPLPTAADPVSVTVIAYDVEGLHKVELFVSVAGGPYQVIPMVDDGTRGDAAAGDSVFTAVIPPYPHGTLVKYYAVATDLAGQIDTWPNSAPANYAAYTVGYTPPRLRITEVMPVNDSTIRDGAGEYDDWIEIQNQEPYAVHLEGMYISNDLDTPRKYRLPAVLLRPQEFLLLWADNQPEQGPLHVDFKLSKDGEAVALFETVDHGNVLIDGWQFGVCGRDISIGYPSPEATTPEYLAIPTPGRSNVGIPLFSPVCINEFQTTSLFGGPKDDWIEIYNRGARPFDLSGCYLSDKRGKNTKWRFPAGTILEPGAFLVVYQDALGFGLPSTQGGVIMLTASDSTTGLDFYDFGPQRPDHTEGRYPDGASTWRFLDKPTPGSANMYSRVQEATNPVHVFELYSNYPNPFNPRTTIRYSLRRPCRVRLEIFDSAGRRVHTLVDGQAEAGTHQILWDGTDPEGRPLPAGVYLLRLKTDTDWGCRKMILAR